MPRTYQLTVADVISKVRVIVQDEDSTEYRATDNELIGWINDAVNAVLGLVPSLFSAAVTHTCTAGARQAVIADRAVAMLDVLGVPECDLLTLAQFSPGWQAGAQGTIKNWIRIQDDPLSFYCVPPSANGQSLTLNAVVSPAPLTATGDLVPLPEAYEAALVDYVAAMTQLKDEESIDFQRQQALMASFAARIKG